MVGNVQEMLNEVWEKRKQLSEDRWNLETKVESPTTKQTSFITAKTIDDDLSMEYYNYKYNLSLFFFILRK